MKPSICILGSNLNRQDPRIFWRQGISLVNAGYEVTYVVSDNLPEETINAIKIIPTGFVTSGRVNRLLFSKNTFYKKAIEINSDIYQISSPELISVGLKLRKNNKKVIFDLREDYASFVLEMKWIPSMILRRFVLFAVKNYLNSALNKYNAVIGVTPLIFDNLKLTACPTFVITNFPIVRNATETSAEEYLNRVDNLCYIGSVYPKSHQQKLFNILSDFKELKYTIFGFIGADLKNELSDLPYWSKVDYINSFSKEKLYEVLDVATIGNAILDYSPNLGYQKGSLGVIKIFEYMEAAIPVICTDFTLWKEIVEKYNCGICVHPQNEKEIQSALEYLIENKMEAYQMGQNGRRAVLEEFNWNSQAVKYIHLIDEITKQEGS